MSPLHIHRLLAEAFSTSLPPVSAFGRMTVSRRLRVSSKRYFLESAEPASQLLCTTLYFNSSEGILCPLIRIKKKASYILRDEPNLLDSHEWMFPIDLLVFNRDNYDRNMNAILMRRSTDSSLQSWIILRVMSGCNQVWVTSFAKTLVEHQQI